jgi:peptidoglycan/LPS O-acetylase OafA/YrhL
MHNNLHTVRSSSNHRPDIDGLRAIAVLSVVGFHAFPSQFKGGFVGVDIFFVISGFLISRIILVALQNNKFSFTDFYIRRIRRICPALLVVVISCAIFGWVGLIPEENATLGKHVAAAMTFTSNLLLWSESGYFDLDSQRKPLLHLWSLGIEMQFYALAPLIFMLLFKFTKQLGLFLGLLFLASFILNLTLVSTYPAANFYLLFSRMFELLAGSLLAVHSLRAISKSNLDISVHKDSAAILGIILIATSVFTIKSNTQFPGYVVLAPIFGSVLLIYAGPTSVVSRYLLSKPLAVKIGLISFPLYLWHWPMLSIAKILYGGNGPPAVRLVLVLIAILLANLVYNYVEKPFRNGRLSTWVFGLFIGMGATFTFGLTSYIAKGESTFNIPYLYQKFYDGDFEGVEFLQTLTKNYKACEENTFLGRAKLALSSVRCKQSKSGENVSTVIVGDSHAESLFPGIANNLSSRNVGVIVSGYAPILGNPGFVSFFKEIQRDDDIKTVIIAAYWIASLTEFVPVGSSLGEEIRKAVDLITGAGKDVYLIVDNHSFSFTPEVCGYSRFPGKAPRCTEEKAVFLDQLALYINEFRKIEAENSKVRILDPTDLLCDAKKCTMVLNGKMLYRDKNHLSIEGSYYLGQWIAARVK